MLIKENFPPLGKNYLLLSYDSLGIDINSTLEGVLSTPLGKFYFATLESVAFVPLDPWGSPFMIPNFARDLIDGLKLPGNVCWKNTWKIQFCISY